MQKDKKQRLRAKIRKKSVLDAINNCLKPADKAYTLAKGWILKAKEKFPNVYRYFESLIRQHIIAPSKSLFKSSKIEGVGSAITANVVKRLPHVDESHIEEIFNDSVNKGKKTYTLLEGSKFKRVLIANRGEIALRVIRACRELSIESVVIYSDEEKNSLPVKFSNKSYNIGKSKNYLDVRKIVKIAKKSNCDAIHPGYGYLSENPKFSKLCEKKGIKFIGPSSKMIKKLGDKVEAKKSMLRVGIPVIEGVKDDLRSKRHALKVARRIGFPIILKASSGGGGKGMRIVTQEGAIFDAYESVKKEALNAFGDDSVYIERYLEEPRHIEFQILADKYGNVIHLGERDCSIQRRHQKLIEESPSPALDKELRESMGNAAVNAIKAIGYEGAGTVEFLLDKSKNFYFIEMNTRIQVEHGVTEMVTNVDLVKEQIKLAEGAKLAYSQEDIKVQGHAIECRINAEDPSNDFAPCPGTVMDYLPPGGPGIRISSPCHTGYEISPQFDSLIALLICHGKTRHEAIERMKRSLDEFVIKGVNTTIPFHKLILSKRQFLKGDVTTSFIENNSIMEDLKSFKRKDDPLSKEKKILIVTTAVSQYLAERHQISSNKAKVSPWVMAARNEAMSEGEAEG